MTDEKPQEKDFGPYTVKIVHFSAVPENNRYEISICFDKGRERRPPQRAKNNSAQLLDNISSELKKNGMEVTKAQSIKMADVHLFSVVCTAPKGMASADFYGVYRAACETAVQKMSESEHARPQAQPTSAALKAQALMRGLKKHGISGAIADAIVADQLRELQHL